MHQIGRVRVSGYVGKGEQYAHVRVRMRALVVVSECEGGIFVLFR